MTSILTLNYYPTLEHAEETLRISLGRVNRKMNHIWAPLLEDKIDDDRVISAVKFAAKIVGTSEFLHLIPPPEKRTFAKMIPWIAWQSLDKGQRWSGTLAICTHMFGGWFSEMAANIMFKEILKK